MAKTARLPSVPMKLSTACFKWELQRGQLKVRRVRDLLGS
jgi:hypothetical protein